MADAYRDGNNIAAMIASSNVDGKTPVRLWADPVTHRLLITAASVLTEISFTGSVNGSNLTFTATGTPTYIVSDGIWLKATDSNSNVQWSIVGSTVTMVVPPTFSIYGF